MSLLFRAAVLLALACLAGCGGGGGGGASDEPQYSISVSPGSVSLSGVVEGPAQTQDVTVTFRGDGVVVGTLPGQTAPPWLTVNGQSQAASPYKVTISADSQAAGNFQTTLRFATGKIDGSKVVTTDVPISFQVAPGARTVGWIRGLARGNSVALRQNNGSPVIVNEDSSKVFQAVAFGTSQTVAVSTQPTGQTCTFDADGSTSITALAAPPRVEHHLTCHASLLPWTWRSGSQAFDVAPVYGTKGVPSATQGPGGRAPAAHAVDADGNLWLFGGSDSSGYHNDLWKYVTSARTWTWLSGSAGPNAPPVYGTQGTADAANVPGARTAATAWIDDAGNFWVFGGLGLVGPGFNPVLLNDLWVFTAASGRWTWVGGSNVGDAQGVYGAAPATTNIPGARMDRTAVKGANGKIWLFGGYGLGENISIGKMNDLWSFEVSSGIWTWHKGENQPTHTGVYGTRGVPHVDNVPRGRSGVSLLFDPAGLLWLFGGADSQGFNNDLWRYDVAGNVWTWISGADTTDPTVPRSQGNYLPPGTTTANMISARYLASAWHDASGNLWFFGGEGLEGEANFAANLGRAGFLNDLWKYEPASNTWHWLSGANVAVNSAVFGTQDVAAVSNMPASRISSAAWADASGAFHLYGGAGSLNSDRRLADFWTFVPR